MSVLERFLHRRENHEKAAEDGFQPTPQESLIIEAYLPEGRGGFKGFCQALDWAGISQERQLALLKRYHVEKPKAMRASGGNQNKA